MGKRQRCAAFEDPNHPLECEMAEGEPQVDLGEEEIVGFAVLNQRYAAESK